MNLERQGIFQFFTFLKDSVVDLLMLLVVSLSVIWFFYLVAYYIWSLRTGHATDKIKQQLPWAIVLLFVVFSVYALISIVASTFGLKSEISLYLYSTFYV